MILRLKLKSSWHKDYCRIRNHWQKLIRSRPTNPHQNTVSTAEDEIFMAQRVLQNQKS
jgi:hypothetical protein